MVERKEELVYAEFEEEDEADLYDEPIGLSCERCGIDLYESDGDTMYCDQCQWWMDQSNKED
jgi:hypothetical protein